METAGGTAIAMWKAVHAREWPKTKEIMEWSPEPFADYTMEGIDNHVLWKKAIEVVTESDAPEWFKEDLCVGQGENYVCSGATILVTTKYETVVQKRRCGLQHFGGGKAHSDLVGKLHEARREGFWEGNYDVSNPATKKICGPL